MKLKLTDEQHDAAFKVWNLHPSGSKLSLRAAIESIEVPDTLPTLRPIAEMPETVPDGCVRLYWGFEDEQGKMSPICYKSDLDTHCIDVLLPAPVDANRAEFEAWAKSVNFDTSRSDDDLYMSGSTSTAWKAWKACNAAKKGAQA